MRAYKISSAMVYLIALPGILAASCGGDPKTEAQEKRPISTTTGLGVARASCPPDFVLTGGGCKCTDAGSLIKSSLPLNNGWQCECTQNGTVQAYAVCASGHYDPPTTGAPPT